MVRKGIVELKAAMSRKLERPAAGELPIPTDIHAALKTTRAELVKAETVPAEASLLEPLYLISDHDPVHYGIPNEHVGRLMEAHDKLEKDFPGWEDRLAGARYECVEKILDGVLRRPERDEATTTDRVDAVLLHPFWGWVFLIAILTLLFYMIFSLAQGPMKGITAGFDAMGKWVEGHMADGDLRDLLVNGIIAGVGGVVVFLPQILILFFFIGLMEDTGYMSRVAFIVDRLMGRVGLNGKSFVPFLSSYACAVPGIMATRTIASVKDRIITIMIAPLASCSARLPVYSLMIAAMFPASEVSSLQKAGMMLAMYAVGTFGAFGFAWLFNRTLLKGQSALMVLEMPTYKRPALRSVVLYMLERAKLFLRRVGTVILGLSIILWASMSYPKVKDVDKSHPTSRSRASPTRRRKEADRCGAFMCLQPHTHIYIKRDRKEERKKETYIYIYIQRPVAQSAEHRWQSWPRHRARHQAAGL